MATTTIRDNAGDTLGTVDVDHDTAERVVTLTLTDEDGAAVTLSMDAAETAAVLAALAARLATITA